MGRLTIEKEAKEMGMYELALNSCYVKDGLARYRDFETDIDCRELARSLMVSYGVWKGMKEHGLDADNELVDDDIFDESILESLQYGTDTIEGLIALFYRNLWAMAYLRTKLKHYEDLEEQGRLMEVVRCKECWRYDTGAGYDGWGLCELYDQDRKDNDYCSFGELKELEGDKE